ncbi:hypothetical protein BX611_2344 [Lutibacter oceani]|uniref:Uncharacterized protein n=1 Tax=Lutibacter oceani TaxID=1853311 RepID=A0A3D9RVM2_9FLAO|nr:hypothetical protein [Lutibacter oceani]REE80692.1 hypothetical protein BX611_2344 [Lutibacter oceani]
MENNENSLMKYFSMVLRKRANGEVRTIKDFGNDLTKYLNRKELIEIISKKFNGSIPKEFNLVEMENEELLEVVGDEMYIISYVTEKWSLTSQSKKQALPSIKEVSKATKK